MHVGRGSDDKSSQPTLAEKASYDYRHQDRKGILDDIICVNDCPGGVSSVRAPDFGEDQVRDHRAVRSVLPKLGGLEGPWKTSAVLPDDADARSTWNIRGIPAENRKRGDEYLSPLR